MAMDFFESQHIAKQKTTRLVVLFVIAVLLIITAVYLVIATAVVTTQNQANNNAPFQWHQLLNLQLLGIVAGGVILAVTAGSFYKMSQLSGGGMTIAEMLGGKLISLDTPDATERRVLNVVEEMAIASGLPVPPVYILDEDGINAFAAGFSPQSAVIGVTRGCAQRLTRDELQGVMAHEFSHILNGDMRINIRLIGVIHGILIIGLIGYYILRAVLYSGRSRRRSKDSNPLPIIAIAIALMVIGFVGTLFGNLIKAAVSRQREFLADAAAVQFTRNGDGISNALKKIGGYVNGSDISHPSAPEASHMFFGQAITRGISFASLFATHPPLPARIKRIDPSWKGKFTKSSAAVKTSPTSPLTSGFAGTTERTNASVAAATHGDAVDQIGQLSQVHLSYAHELLTSLPHDVASAAHEPYGARAIVFCLLLDRDQAVRQRQLQHLKQSADQGVYDATIKLTGSFKQVDQRARLPLIDISTTALRSISPAQFSVFEKNLVALIEADDRVSLFEWALHRMIIRHVGVQFNRVKQPRAKYYSLTPLTKPCALLLSTLARIGHTDADKILNAFTVGWQQLKLRTAPLLDADQCTLKSLGEAIDAINEVVLREKRKVLRACAACISSDQQVTVNEAELLRAISDSLDCPMPPLLPGQPLIN